jgi:hypothetical protein
MRKQTDYREQSIKSTKVGLYRKKRTTEERRDTILKQQRTIKRGESLTLVGSYQWKNLTDRDIDLRIEYATDLLSNTMGVDSKFIHLKERTKSATAVSMSETYTVKVGVKEWGVVSIRTQGLSNKYSMFIIVQRKKGSIGRKVKK